MADVLSIIRCRRFWLWSTIALLLAVTVSALTLLRFGNPQWNRLIYIAQFYWLGHHELCAPPKGYTGRWRRWYPDGSLQDEYQIIDGVKTGLVRGWHANGAKWRELTLDLSGELHGPFKVWDESGKQLLCGEYRHGMPWSGTLLNLPAKLRGLGTQHGEFKEGVLLKIIREDQHRRKELEAEYLAEYDKNPKGLPMPAFGTTERVQRPTTAETAEEVE